MTRVNLIKYRLALIILILGISGCTSEDVLFPDLANFFLIVFGLGMLCLFEKLRGWAFLILLFILMIFGAWKIVWIILGTLAFIFLIGILIPSSDTKQGNNLFVELFTIPEEKVTRRKEFASKGEQKLYDIIKELYPEEKVKIHDSPDWLGGNQHIDIHLPKRRIAIEYQGKQHFEPVEYYGGKKGFWRQQKLDERKRKRCKSQGVSLIYFNYDETITRRQVRKKVEAANPQLKEYRQNIRKSGSLQFNKQLKNTDVVTENSLVKLRYVNNNKTITVNLVNHPISKFDSSKKIKLIHKNCPLAKAIIGKRIGEKSRIQLNNYVEILDIIKK